MFDQAVLYGFNIVFDTPEFVDQPAGVLFNLVGLYVEVEHVAIYLVLMGLEFRLRISDIGSEFLAPVAFRTLSTSTLLVFSKIAIEG